MDIIREAIERRDAREARAAERPRTDYAAANVAFRKQKAALTRAVNTRDPEKVAAACKKAVTEWGQAPFHGAWPDDWARWQRALDDILPWNARVDLGDL